MSDFWSFVGASPQDTARITDALSAWQPRVEGFERQFADFYQALRWGAALPVTLADTRRATELLTAIYVFARTRASVSLPLGEDFPQYASWLP